MKPLIQHEPLVVEEFEATAWGAPQLLRDHFALVSIRWGIGHYLTHHQLIPYQADTLLLLGPADSYHFAIDQPTRFGLLRFTDDYLGSLTAVGPYAGAWQQLRAAAPHTPLGRVGGLAPGLAEPQLSALLAILFAEGAGHPPVALAASLMGAVLSFVSRQLAAPPQPAAHSYAAGVVQRLLAHIRHHIAEPGRLRIEALASTFAYSPSHLSELFRQETGESLHQYIVRYRLWLAENQLELSTLSVSQIADELGFVDVCHLNKLFKKRYRLTPTEYRRQRTAGPTYASTSAYALR
jgi:AraC family L-rhamnose operon regulatory protein RhaS